MSTLRNRISAIDSSADRHKSELFDEIREAIESVSYRIAECNDQKPWGGYFRITSEQADDFLADFFPDLNHDEARLGDPNAELSPKLLIVAPHQRLSWQMHHRRAERWIFLTDGGGYYKSSTDVEGLLHQVPAGCEVQFAKGERHRLVSVDAGYVIVAEIWQYSDPLWLSDEDDIVRIQDDYVR